MGGHNKWSQIKRQKEKTDAAKSSAFGKLARRITIESKKANGDVNAANVRAAIDAAKAANMPKENIERAVAKGISPDASTLESITYEAYGPGGVALIIDTLTDSRNRTAQEIKHLLSKNGIALAAPGSALWAFDKTAEGYIPKQTMKLSETDDATLMQLMEQIDAHEDVQEVYTNAE
jgi:YebC/PmpR family DNA-binding regulatory protein